MKHAITFLFTLLTVNLNAQNYSAEVTVTDAVGRKWPDQQQAGGLKKDKYVGLFYWTWHTQQAKNNPALNVTEYLARDPKAVQDYNNPIWPKRKSPWFWAEPLFGYYVNTDVWVLRKHAEMLADAGVDMVIFDCTNGNLTWKESYMKLCEVWTQARKDGVKTPQIAFMLPFWVGDGGKEIIREIYRDLYKPGNYKDLWFRWKGKPFIMADPAFTEAIKDQPADPALQNELRAFFTFRPGQPVYNKGPEKPDHWGWLEIYPQHGFKKTADGTFEQAPVGVAQNWTKERGLTALNATGSFGRSYTHQKGHITEPGAVNYGYNFQEQWDRALEINPELVFITGWNEWIAGRYDVWQQQANAFPDEFDQEGSRDIEPMKGGHGDNYYYQMAANIRRFKGLPAKQPVSPPVTIRIDGEFEEWAAVTPAFSAHKGNTFPRNSPGWGSFLYRNNTGRNDIVLTKVARDGDNIYFYAETAKPLTPKTDPGWMRLFINTDRDKNTGWEGYDLVINRVNPGPKATVEKTDAGWNWQPAGEVDYAVSQNRLEIKVPKSLLGLNGEPNFEFKWSDNMGKDGDVMDFWQSGDAAPAGRANYVYSIDQ